MSTPWQIYHRGRRSSEAELERWLAQAPPWRQPGAATVIPRVPPVVDPAWERRGTTYFSSGAAEARQVNLALMLRRPLLVTGRPGVGKSTLGYHVAHALGLGPPLRWEISSRTTLEEGLFNYDAVAHLQAARTATGGEAPLLGDFITLGPLGTAFLPTPRPRVLLIDELDKASYDLPNDLLHVFEEASFRIPQLIRLSGVQQVYPHDRRDADDRVPIELGTVRAHHHPVVVITSNGERDFPPAFLRRCIGLTLDIPSAEQMARIVELQLDGKVSTEAVERLLKRMPGRPTDVVLQALFLEQEGVDEDAVDEGLAR